MAGDGRAERFGRRFLARPGQARTWRGRRFFGDEEALLECAGGPFVIRGLGERQLSILLERYGGWLREVGRERRVGATAIDVYRAPTTDFLSRLPAEHYFEVDQKLGPDAVELASRRVLARLDWRPSLRVSVWTDVYEGPEVEAVFENLLRIMVAYRLVDLGGALLHSAGVVVGERALLVAGRSGAGKSTLAAKAEREGFAVASDDLNALMRSDGEVCLGRVPFGGDLEPKAEGPASIPLQGICRLEKSDRLEVERLSSGAAMAALLAACPFVNRDPYRASRLESNVEAALAETPVWRLGLPLEASVGEALRLLEAEA
jgi:hypothetical protein